MKEEKYSGPKTKLTPAARDMQSRNGVAAIPPRPRTDQSSQSSENGVAQLTENVNGTETGPEQENVHGSQQPTEETNSETHESNFETDDEYLSEEEEFWQEEPSREQLKFERTYYHPKTEKKKRKTRKDPPKKKKFDVKKDVKKKSKKGGSSNNEITGESLDQHGLFTSSNPSEPKKKEGTSADSSVPKEKEGLKDNSSIQEKKESSNEDSKNSKPKTPDKMTYHHIIPRNKLGLFWSHAKNRGELSYLSKAMSVLIYQAENRIKSTPGLEKSTAFEIHGNKQSAQDLNRIMSKIRPESLDSDLSSQDQITKQRKETQKEGETIIQTIFQWWPANIHHGPTDRPTSINPETDDGGNSFEISAKHLIPSKVYDDLFRMNELLDIYIGNPSSGGPVVKKIGKIIKRLSTITDIHPYNSEKWIQIEEGDLKGKWRVVP